MIENMERKLELLGRWMEGRGNKNSWRGGEDFNTDKGGGRKSEIKGG